MANHAIYIKLEMIGVYFRLSSVGICNNWVPEFFSIERHHTSIKMYQELTMEGYWKDVTGHMLRKPVKKSSSNTGQVINKRFQHGADLPTVHDIFLKFSSYNVLGRAV